MRVSLLALAMAALVCSGCDRSPAPISAGSGPPFDPIAFFQGHTHSWGVMESRSGAPTEWVVTDSHGENGADGLRMVQQLLFQDGTTQHRDWVLHRTGPDQFEATANDMVGSAKGSSDGNIFHWQWVLARSPGNSLMNLTMTQWMYRLEDGSVMIRTTVSKLGIILAEVTERFAHPAKDATVG